MSVFYRCIARILVVAVASAAVAACGRFDSASQRVASVVTPYRVEVVQGNFVSKEQVAALQPGLGRQQVREILGTPLIASVFHADRWDYVFTIKRRNVDAQVRKLSVFFKDDVLERFEGDEMPSESEFVSTLEHRKPGKVPVLEASEEKLRKFPAPSQPASTPADANAEVPPPNSYPPLEAPQR